MMDEEKNKYIPATVLNNDLWNNVLPLSEVVALASNLCTLIASIIPSNLSNVPKVVIPTVPTTPFHSNIPSTLTSPLGFNMPLLYKSLLENEQNNPATVIPLAPTLTNCTCHSVFPNDFVLQQHFDNLLTTLASRNLSLTRELVMTHWKHIQPTAIDIPIPANTVLPQANVQTGGDTFMSPPLIKMRPHFGLYDTRRKNGQLSHQVTNFLRKFDSNPAILTNDETRLEEICALFEPGMLTPNRIRKYLATRSYYLRKGRDARKRRILKQRLNKDK